MFDESARYYDVFYGDLDYATASDRLQHVLRTRHPEATTLLDVACGSGRHIERLRTHYRVSGLDIQPDILALAGQRCPGVPLIEGNMLEFSLEDRFDVITCLFCSIAYMITLEHMQRAVARMAAHLAPGGLLVIEPWIAPEQCWTDRINCEVHDRERQLKVVRMHTHQRSARTSIYDIHYLVGTPDEVKHFVEREELGLFTRSEYADALSGAGLVTEWLDIELFPGHRYGLHLGRKPEAA